jgi:hypothetical protein
MSGGLDGDLLHAAGPYEGNVHPSEFMVFGNIQPKDDCNV